MIAIKILVANCQPFPPSPIISVKMLETNYPPICMLCNNYKNMGNLTTPTLCMLSNWI